MKFTGTLREPEKLTASFPALKLPLSGGYEEGYADGRTAGYAEGEQTGYDRGMTDGVEQGKQAEYDRFWDAFQQNGDRYDYLNAFQGSYWTDEVYNPKYPIMAWAGNVLNSAFNNNYSITDTKVPIVVGRAGQNGTAGSAFANCQNLKTIQSLDITNASSLVNTFYQCKALVNIKIVGTISISVSFQHSALLSYESIQSLIDALADLTGETAQTLTFHATVGAKLTDEQKATIAAKNWTLAY